jgi:hypothetical protein
MDKETVRKETRYFCYPSAILIQKMVEKECSGKLYGFQKEVEA